MKYYRFFIILMLPGMIAACATTYSQDGMAEDIGWSVVEALYDSQYNTLAVSHISVQDGVDPEIGDYIQRGITTEIANAVFYEKAALKIISRQQLDQLITEQSFQLTDMVDPESQAEVGRLLGADLIMTGSVTWLEDDVYNLNAQILEVETGVVVGGFKYEFWRDTESED